MRIEREIKFYFPIARLGDLKSRLKIFKYMHTKYELTLNYDNPNSALSFYDKKIDGRLRLRIMRYLDSRDKGKVSGLFSWKQRIPEHALSKIRHEHEVECRLSGEDADNMKIILSDVLKCPLISSYERERAHYHVDGLDITLDKFPYGLMLEIEIKDEVSDHSELTDVLKKLKLDTKDSSNFSCDDMYKHLCHEQGKPIKPHILFDDTVMPLFR